MVFYNVTIHIRNEQAEEWQAWMKAVHIPEVMATGLFEEHRFCRVISLDEEEYSTFSIQYACADMATLHRYQVQHAPRLQQAHTERYRDQFLAFRSIMETV
jgi:hypothetical protein